MDLLIPNTESQAIIDYHVNLVNPSFSKVIPLFTSIDPVVSVQQIPKIQNLFSAGRSHVGKGYIYLIDAMHNLSNIGHDLQLTIAGDGPEMKNLIRQRDVLDLQKIYTSLELRTRWLNS